MIFSYLRVSSKSQSLERQRQSIETYAAEKGITIDRVFEEKASGKDFTREVYQAMKLTLRRSDVLIITELDRLGRDMAAIRDEWRELEQSGIDIVVLENELLSTAYKTDLEKTLISHIVLELLAYVAQKEREKTRARQASGIAIAKANGKYRGRKPIHRVNFAEVYSRWHNKEITAVKAMEILDLKKDTFYRLAREQAKKEAVI